MTTSLLSLPIFSSFCLKWKRWWQLLSPSSSVLLQRR
jgi:hypothetical protein